MADEVAVSESHREVKQPVWKSNALRGLLVIATIAMLKIAEPLLLPIASALVLTFVFAPMVRGLRRYGVREAYGAAVVVTLLIVSTLLLGSTLAGPAAQWWERAPSTVAQVLAQIDRLRGSILRTATPPPTAAPRPRSAAAAERAAAAAPDPLKDQLATEGVALTRVVIARVLTFALSTAAAIILLYFLLASEHWMLSRSVEAIPRRRTRALLVAGVRSAEQEIGRFVGSLALVNLGVALVTGTAVWWLGMPNPVLWGAIAGMLNFIPYLGPVITATLLGLAGVVSFDVASDMLAPVLVFLLIHAVESNIVSPWYVGRRLTLSPLAVFISVLFWGWMWGIVGAMLAVPMLVGLRSVCKRNRRLRLLCAYLEGAHKPVPSLRSLLLPRRRGAHAEVPPG